MQRVAGCMKCRGKRIADDPKDNAMIYVNGLIQDGIVARQQFWHLIGMFLREFGASLNIGEEKGDGTCRKLVLVSHLNG
jgi:hypothetical protein